jgi:C4-dicarboxylate-binding protein DctP
MKREGLAIAIIALLLIAIHPVNAVFAGAAYNADKAEFVIKMGYSPGAMAPTESMEIMYGDAFKKYVEEKTNGRIFVEIYPSDALGSAPDTLGAISVGSVHMSLFDVALYSIYNKSTMVFSLPGIFRNREEVTDIFNSKWAFDNIFNDLEKNNNLKVLGGLSKGFRNFTANNRTFRKPEDIKGLSIRVMDSAMYVKMVEALSANPVIIAGSEMYTAMKNGVVDGHENSLLNIWQDKTYEVQNRMVMDLHIPSVQVWVISALFFNDLPPELQTVVKDGNTYAHGESLKVVNVLNTRIMDNLRKEGMEIYEPTPNEVQAWHDLYGPPCEKYLRSLIDPKIVDSFIAAIEEYRNKK